MERFHTLITSERNSHFQRLKYNRGNRGHAGKNGVQITAVYLTAVSLNNNKVILKAGGRGSLHQLLLSTCQTLHGDTKSRPRICDPRCFCKLDPFSSSLHTEHNTKPVSRTSSAQLQTLGGFTGLTNTLTSCRQVEPGVCHINTPRLCSS